MRVSNWHPFYAVISGETSPCLKESMKMMECNAHAILACSTESAQDDVLKRFLESKTRSVIQEKSNVTPKNTQKNATTP